MNAAHRSLTLLALLVGLWLCAAELRSAEDAQLQPRVDIYTSASCGYCRVLKRYLGTRDIDFVEHNINATLESREAFYAMGGRGTPLVVIDGQMIHGFDPLRIEAALDDARAAVPQARGKTTDE